MKFKDYFSLRQIVFAIFVVALVLVFALIASARTVEVELQDSKIYIESSKYLLSVSYDEIEKATLEPLAQPGEKLEHGFDDDILRAGKWKNETWGEYHICADLDTKNCVVLHLKDGRKFVFNLKNDQTTEEIYQQLLVILPNA